MKGKYFVVLSWLSSSDKFIIDMICEKNLTLVLILKNILIKLMTKLMIKISVLSKNYWEKSYDLSVNKRATFRRLLLNQKTRKTEELFVYYWSMDWTAITNGELSWAQVDSTPPAFGLFERIVIVSH